HFLRPECSINNIIKRNPLQRLLMHALRFLFTMKQGRSRHSYVQATMCVLPPTSVSVHLP
ncbi:unnamed protein product, partial [Musa hybrid cultivar]